MKAWIDIGIGGHGIQETIERPARLAWRGVRMTAFAYVGLYGLAVNGAWLLLRHAGDLLTRAEQRGEQIEQAAMTRLHALDRRGLSAPDHRAASLENGAQHRLMPMRAVFDPIEHELDHRIEELLAKLGIPTRERLTQLNAEIDAVMAQIDARLAALEQQQTAAEPPHKPFGANGAHNA